MSGDHRRSPCRVQKTGIAKIRFARTRGRAKRNRALLSPLEENDAAEGAAELLGGVAQIILR
ncbi:MAG: hypothetical protein ACREPT_08235, partial [Rudaea sp.]